MSVLDRVRRAGTAKLDTGSISPVPADDPVIERTRAIIGFAIAQIENQGASLPFFFKSLLTEVMEELGELNSDDMASYMMYCSQIMKWIATGKVDDMPEGMENALPDELRLALPAGT